MEGALLSDNIQINVVTKYKDFLDQCSQVDYNIDLDDESDLERDGPVINSKYYDIADVNSLTIDYDSSHRMLSVSMNLKLLNLLIL